MELSPKWNPLNFNKKAKQILNGIDRAYDRIPVECKITFLITYFHKSSQYIERILYIENIFM